MAFTQKFRRLYQSAKSLRGEEIRSGDLATLFSEATIQCIRFLHDQAELIELESDVPDKTYCSYFRKKKLSRPFNVDLFIANIDQLSEKLQEFVNGEWEALGVDGINKTLYTIQMSFSIAGDLLGIGRKTPATYFECLVGHFLARIFDVRPQTQIEVLNLDMRGQLTTDYIFDLGENQPKFHVPIKTSTRERIIMVWAHQRVLDGIYGMGRFRGIAVILTETKLNKKSRRVTEICVPFQWHVYQMYLALMTRIYYLDVPARYARLGEEFPRIYVKTLGEFWFEREELLS